MREKHLLVVLLGCALLPTVVVADAGRVQSRQDSVVNAATERFKAVTRWKGTFQASGLDDVTTEFEYRHENGGISGTVSLVQTAPLVWYGTFHGAWTNHCTIRRREPPTRSVYVASGDNMVVFTVPVRFEIRETDNSFLIDINNGMALSYSDTLKTDVYESGVLSSSTVVGFDYDWNGPFGETASWQLPVDGTWLYGSTELRSAVAEPCARGDAIPWQVAATLVPDTDTPEQLLCGATQYDPAVQCCVNNGVVLKYPIVELSQCPDRKQRSNPTPNGCGTPENPLPESFLYVNWRWACDKHDRCYSDCTSTKETCDSAFEADVGGECLGGTLTPLLAALCYSGAKAAVEFPFSTVTAGQDGKSAYLSAQREACQCCL